VETRLDEVQIVSYTRRSVIKIRSSHSSTIATALPNNLHHSSRLLAYAQLDSLVCKRPREESGFHHTWEILWRRHLESIRNLGFEIGHDIPD
jgi:hypothetical protein